MGNSTSCKIVPPKNIILKLCTRDYVGRVTRHANTGFNRYSGGFSPNSEILLPCDFFDCSVLSCPVLSLTFFSILRPGRTAEPIFTLWLKRRVSAQGWSFWGLGRWMTIFGENMQPKLLTIGLNRLFQAKTAKLKNHNISKTINRIKTKFEDQAETGNCTSRMV